MKLHLAAVAVITAFSLLGCAAKPAPKAFDPDNYEAVVRDQAIRIAPPIEQPRAKYPTWQAAKRQDGWVYLEYTILANGRTADIKVLDSSPKGIFEQSAIEAVKQYRYKPIVVDGRVISVDRVRTKITFDAP